MSSNELEIRIAYILSDKGYNRLNEIPFNEIESVLTEYLRETLKDNTINLQTMKDISSSNKYLLIALLINWLLDYIACFQMIKPTWNFDSKINKPEIIRNSENNDIYIIKIPNAYNYLDVYRYILKISSGFGPKEKPIAKELIPN